ncbi:MAG: hypothetical protein OXN86_08265 [Chloroflexota bacterium]|nr:hypothetical protein [Rhodospirillales bacterium]MDE2892478.1 hypothetical protein [Chloroflexota bacterium]
MSAERIPIANVYYLLCYAWRHVDERDLVELDALDELDRVHDLLATVLVQGAFRLARQGIDRGYRDVREDLAGIRGKVDVGRTVKRALRGRGQVACAFEELTLDVPHNRILRSTLSALLRVRDLDRDVRAGVRSAHEKLAGVTVVRVTRRMFDQVQLDGNRRYYRFLLSVCRLVHDLLLVDPRSGEHRFSGLTDAVMWKVYEDFVIEFYRREQDRYRVNRRGRTILWAREGTHEDERSKLPRMQADAILEAEDRRIIMDAKYYPEALRGAFGGKLRSDHLYQLLAYLRNREATEAAGAVHEGLLLYPTVGEAISAKVRLEGHRIQARSIDLSKNWKDIHDDMLQIIA